MDPFVPSLKRSVWIILTAILLAGAFCCPPVFAAAESSEAEEAVAPGEVIVVFEDNKAGQAASSDAGLEQIEEENPVTAAEEIVDSVGEDGKCVLLTLEGDADAEAAASELSELPGVAYAQPNYRYQLFDADESDTDAADTYLDQQHSLNPWDPAFPDDQILGANIAAAWNLLGGIGDADKAPVTIAVLDTGCQLTHEDLRGTVLADLAYDSVTDTAGADSVTDTDGHGTHVAGVVAAEAENGAGIAGAAGNYARFIPINIFRSDGAYTEEMLVAFHYLEQLMETGEIPQLRIINMSIGRYGSLDDSDYALESCIAAMREKGVLTVCAGGNGDGTDAYRDSFSFPGDFEECLSVTSLDKQGNNTRYSDYSMEKDISAPGNEILSAVRDGDFGKDGLYWGDREDGYYDTKSGTSMSAPLVAGIAALLWADQAELSVDQVVKALCETAHPVNTAKYDRTGLTGSAGAVDAAAALEYAREHADDPPEDPDDPVVDPDDPVVDPDDPGTDAYDQGQSEPVKRLAKVSTFSKGKFKYRVTSASAKAPKVKVIRAKVSGTSKIPAAVSYGKVSYTVTSIGQKAFRNCKKLKKLTIPASVKIIGKEAFLNCKKLKKLTIPASVKSIGTGAFRGCKALKTLVIRTELLTKKGVKGSLKGSKVEKVKVKLGSKKRNQQYVRKYRKFFRKANSGRYVVVFY